MARKCVSIFLLSAGFAVLACAFVLCIGFYLTHTVYGPANVPLVGCLILLLVGMVSYGHLILVQIKSF